MFKTLYIQYIYNISHKAIISTLNETFFKELNQRQGSGLAARSSYSRRIRRNYKLLSSSGEKKLEKCTTL